MKVWFKIAIRNILKNARRSAFTILAISVGFGAVNIFGGFQSYIFQGLRDALIYAQAQGHVTVMRKSGTPGDAENDPVRSLITAPEIKAVQKEAEAYPETLLVTEHIQISGLLSNGDISAVFIAIGRTPSHMDFFRSHAKGMIGRIKLFTGDPLLDGTEYGIGISSGLAERLKVGIGSDVIAMAPTVDGQINAMDAKVLQLFDAPSAEMNDKFGLVPLKFAKSLYHTEGIDRVLILLRETAESEKVRDRLNHSFLEGGLDLEALTWEETAPFYIKVKDLFNVIFWFLFIIVLIIVVMSVINTMSMAIMERIREVGTIRAIGVKRREVMKLFAVESLVLSFIGSILGTGFTLLGWLAMKMIQPTWIPPHITIRVPIEVYLVPGYMIATGLILMLLSVTAAVFPARKAAGMNIVDALGHV